MKYVFNARPNNVKCKYAPAGVDRANPLARDLAEITFRPEVFDSFSGRIVFNGYTPVEDSLLVALNEQSALFRKMLETKSLVVFDDLPDDAKSVSDVAAELRAQIADLTAKNNELTALLEGDGKGDLNKKIKQLESDLAETKAALKDAGEQNGVLNEEVGRLTSELEKLTKANG